VLVACQRYMPPTCESACKKNSFAYVYMRICVCVYRIVSEFFPSSVNNRCRSEASYKWKVPGNIFSSDRLGIQSFLTAGIVLECVWENVTKKSARASACKLTYCCMCMHTWVNICVCIRMRLSTCICVCVHVYDVFCKNILFKRAGILQQTCIPCLFALRTKQQHTSATGHELQGCL
jgi:hypothetical protein